MRYAPVGCTVVTMSTNVSPPDAAPTGRRVATYMIWIGGLVGSVQCQDPETEIEFSCHNLFIFLYLYFPNCDKPKFSEKCQKREMSPI